MRKSFVALLLALGAASLANLAFAAEYTGSDDFGPKLMNAQMAKEMRTRAAALGTSSHVPNDTTFVGFNPAYAYDSGSPSTTNWWSIGVGHRRPRGTHGPGKGDIEPVPNDDRGYWDWEDVSYTHGDSLQGWWPVRWPYPGFFVASLLGDNRPWVAVDAGNCISQVVNLGDPNRGGPGAVEDRVRTFGVTSAWHVDPGVSSVVTGSGGGNPSAPRWTALAGSKSAWCGLRSHNDVTVVDAYTGNPYNADAIRYMEQHSPTVPVSAGGTDLRLPGYIGQWDQMLYRDIDIGTATGNVSVGFKLRTRMSTLRVETPTSRTGWFDKDPLSLLDGNYIKSNLAGAEAPIDSFMVYVGCPVADEVGAEWIDSNGATQNVFDPVRRWFGETIRANEDGKYYELYTTWGDNPPILAPGDSNAVVDVTATRAISYSDLRTACGGNKIRLVFRVKTNRLFDDAGASVPLSYNSGYLGAAQVDAVTINLGSGAVAIGNFENDSDINNSMDAVAPIDSTAEQFWKTSSKPPPIYHHVDDLSGLPYADLCGLAGDTRRICDMAGNVISQGDHDASEALSGEQNSTEQERFEGIVSPTVNLAFDPGNPTAKNNMGLDAASATPTNDYGMIWNYYSGNQNIFVDGNGYQHFAQSYPARQADGQICWGAPRFSRFQNFNPDKQCYEQLEFLGDFGQVFTINPGGLPDSIRIGFRHLGQCYRFGVTTTCGGIDGNYWDNASLAIIDGATKPISGLIWEFIQDTFPFNEGTTFPNGVAPGTPAFDTTTALIKAGRNGSPTTANLLRYNVAADTTQIEAAGEGVELQLVFRILPGPGNYVSAGNVCSGLRRVPTDPTPIDTEDGSFWTEYILNNGKGPDFPTTDTCGVGGSVVPAPHERRWNSLVWCTARCDTAEQNLFPIAHRSINTPIVGGTYATMYHEDDKHLVALALPRHKCFLVDPEGAVNNTNTTCDAVPAWVTAGGPPFATGYDGSETTTEGTKILPDGLLTPGSHVQYFFFKKGPGVGEVAMCPDTNLVSPQESEGSFDAHRWQQFSVLPDAWKFSTYGGMGKACMLYVDWNDRRGEERIWVSVSDSIGATSADKRGAHNGWSAAGGVSVNNPAGFVNKNAQPGTTWDMYGVKASESLNTTSGALGGRLAHRAAGSLYGDPLDPNTWKWSRIAPTPDMLKAYYSILMIQSGDLNSFIIGPDTDRSDHDTNIISNFLSTAEEEDHRGILCGGHGFVEDAFFAGNSDLLGLLGVDLVSESYIAFSLNNTLCTDLIPTSVITTNGDVYGLRNTCTFTLDVLTPVGDGQVAVTYEPVDGEEYVAGVFVDAEPPLNPNNHFQALTNGWDMFNMRQRECDTGKGRLAYFINVWTNVFGKICSIQGAPGTTLDTPNNNEGRTFVQFAGQNPLRQGNAEIKFALAKDDRVTVKIYDVSGRLVRTLADKQWFKSANSRENLLTWDGLDNSARQVSRGVYFVTVKLQNSMIEKSRKMIVLK